MPNYVKHIVSLSGKAKAVAELVAFAQNGELLLDFNKIIPMPKELEGTVSPQRIISEAEYKKEMKRIASGDLTPMEKAYGLGIGITQKLSNQYKLKYGADNWYDWKIENWGTKWGVGECEFEDNRYTFDTAWSTPVKIFEALSKMFKTVSIRVQFADEDFGQNVGEYTLLGGVCVKENIPEGGSDEALEMALGIRDDEYMITDYLAELNDKQLDESYAKSLIRMAHKKGKLINEYPVKVLNTLLEMAVADEQYERAEEIKIIIELSKKSV